VCIAQPDIGEIEDDPADGLRFRARSDEAVGHLSASLVESGALVLELSPRHATLEDLFFQLTEDHAGNGAERAAVAV
jgi:hypothetical protein